MNDENKTVTKITEPDSFTCPYEITHDGGTAVR